MKDTTTAIADDRRKNKVQAATLAELDPCVTAFLNSTATMSQSTAETYRFRLYPFIRYLSKMPGKTVSQLVSEIKKERVDVYSLLSDYASYLQLEISRTGKGSSSLKRRVNVVKLVLLFNDCDISEMKLKTKLKLPRAIRRQKEPIDKQDVRVILLACEDIRVKTYLMLLAGTGMRAREALALRFQDFDLTATPPRINIPGEVTKTRTDRYVFLTAEFVKQFEDYGKWRHRERRIVYYDKNGKSREVIFKPEYHANELVFSIAHRDAEKNASVRSMYVDMLKKINATIDRIGKGQWEQAGTMRKITRHTFRRFVKSVISDLGYGDYSEWFIGHSGSTYYRKKEYEQAEIFRKIEPSLTFLDNSVADAVHRDVSSQLEASKDRIKKLEERQSMYDDLLSDPKKLKKYLEDG